MTEKMMSKLIDLKLRQDSREYMACPRCGQNTLKDDLHTNALSRHAAGIYVCDSCGTSEALLDFMKQELPLTQWAFFRPQRPVSGFRSMRAMDVLARVMIEQIQPLTQIYKQCLAKPGNSDEFRTEAFESCPGLTELWTQPFAAKYDTAEKPVLIRFHVTEDGSVEYTADIIGDK